ncbi:MAG: EAL domain-containing protein [Xanthomonadaceae bacterium]|nr:EAL domain-containing protein [Xanthomonadaceae bacterium]
MAFQPIVNTATGKIFAHEALVRGPNGEPAGSVFESVNPGNQYRFDQCCRVKAIELAARLGAEEYISINFMPNAVYKPELCIRTTLAAAKKWGFPTERIIFEVTEGEKIDDLPHLKNIIRHYQEIGFKTAIDDFGSGFAGLNLLADFRADIVKLDMALVRDIDSSSTRRAIIRGIMGVAEELSTQVIAEGVETIAEWKCLEDLGVEYFQGFLFARPSFESLAEVTIPKDEEG